eukprot:TRINITY_DN8198_c0_g1_i1.p1 TRINITY_DN8198_c0_g1~~TRINITY_DN8198_c0_g1_i1.p1  ORF type:complete len:115 (+),score=18.43 TRINITY_DN8198_c0_g1_i1:49-345(+)
MTGNQRNWYPFPEWLRNAPNLVDLYLMGNISGTIPTEIGLLTNLQQLTCIGPPLTGTIPTEIGQMRSVRGINFSQMKNLTGPIPYLSLIHISEPTRPY